MGRLTPEDVRTNLPVYELRWFTRCATPSLGSCSGYVYVTL